MLLELEGHRVRTAGTGAEAVQRAAPPLDVAVIDIGLPEMDGYDVARRIRPAGRPSLSEGPRRRAGPLPVEGRAGGEPRRRHPPRRERASPGGAAVAR
jgi:CheY-like chemotaxis protein